MDLKDKIDAVKFVLQNKEKIFVFFINIFFGEIRYLTREASLLLNASCLFITLEKVRTYRLRAYKRNAIVIHTGEKFKSIREHGAEMCERKSRKPCSSFPLRPRLYLLF